MCGGNQPRTVMVSSAAKSKLQVQAAVRPISSFGFLNPFPEKLAGIATLELASQLET